MDWTQATLIEQIWVCLGFVASIIFGVIILGGTFGVVALALLMAGGDGDE